jgi:hypothetical protein
MGKGSGTCSRQPLEIGAGVNQAGSEAGSVPITSKTDYLGNIDLNLKRLNFSDKVKWISADYQVLFNKNPEGWYVSANNTSFKDALLKIGLDKEDTIFPSFKEAREAVADAALHSNLNLDPKLKRPATSGYQIGNLPLRVSRSTGSWTVAQLCLPQLPVEIADYFAEGTKGTEEFWGALEETPVLKTNYPTRQSAVSEVKEWLLEYIKSWPPR